MGPEKFQAPSPETILTVFQSVSGLWDRRNWQDTSSPCSDTGFNPSPVCGTGEIPSRGRYGRDAGVSIRLRSVGPEKFGGYVDAAWVALFQSVSGLWDRRNRVRPAEPMDVNPFQSVSGLWDRRNIAGWSSW